MLRDHLELFVFTYNRAAPLACTLEQLHDSPFADCRITVLDNCSSDETPSVCESWATRFREFTTVRHRRNIGLGANYLRAVELSRSEYTWTLSDDETYDFSDCEDVLDSIESGVPDLISLGAPGQGMEERGLKTTTQQLVARGSSYFFVFTFVAGVIFRTEQFDSECVVAGYHDVRNLYPQFSHLYRCFQENRVVHTSRNVLVHRNVPPIQQTVGSNLLWFTGFVRACARIEDPGFRRRSIYQVCRSHREWFWYLAVHVARERAERPDRLGSLLADLLRVFSWDQRLLMAVLLPLALMPPALLRSVQTALGRLRPTGPQSDRSETFDILRL